VTATASKRNPVQRIILQLVAVAAVVFLAGIAVQRLRPETPREWLGAGMVGLFVAGIIAVRGKFTGTAMAAATVLGVAAGLFTASGDVAGKTRDGIGTAGEAGQTSVHWVQSKIGGKP
jgi:glycerol uptake facilitator-like aquaporin